MQYLKLSEEQLNDIILSESKKTVGMIMKRYEIIDDKNVLKLETKELIYEAYRNIRSIFLHCAKSNTDIYLENTEVRKEK